MTSFATILRQALNERGITASDLARRIWGGDDDDRNGAKNRQIISQYLNGRSRPKLAMLERIAAALQMPVSELAPSLAPTDRLTAGFEGDKIRLKIDRAVDPATAMKIIGMLSA